MPPSSAGKSTTLLRLLDVPIRILLGLFFAFSAGIYFKNAIGNMATLDWAHPSLAQIIDAFSILAIGLYTFLIACLYAIRLKPVNKFAGIIPAITAIGGGFLVSAILLLAPRAELPLTAKLIAAALILIGNIFAAYVLSHLGRSFSILPEGRRLVTTGSYRYIRHPLYAAEAVATIGAMINFFSIWAVVIVVMQLVLQLGRIHYEEKVLRATFPEYAAYAKRTARLIPGVY